MDEVRVSIASNSVKYGSLNNEFVNHLMTFSAIQKTIVASVELSKIMI